MDDFERYLAERTQRNPQCFALMEALMAGYKVCHPVEPNGMTGQVSGLNDADGLLVPRRPNADLPCPPRGPSLWNLSLCQCKPTDSRQTAGYPNVLGHASNTNIVLESVNGNNKIQISVKDVLLNLRNFASRITARDANVQKLLLLLKSDGMTEVCNALFTIVIYALFANQSRTNSDETTYAIIGTSASGPIYMDFRIANHFVNPSRMENKNKGERVPVEHHFSLTLNDVELRKARIARGELKKGGAGTRFKPGHIHRVEVIVKLDAFNNDPSVTLKLVATLYKMFSTKDITDHDIKTLFDTELDEKIVNVKVVDAPDATTSTNTSPENTSETKQSTQKPIGSSDVRNEGVIRTNKQPLTNLVESVMNTYQQSYIAFIENVCEQFDCIEALPALTKGFNAFCECADYCYKTTI